MKLKQRQLSALLSILLLSLSLCQFPLLVLAAPTLNTEDGTFTAQRVEYHYGDYAASNLFGNGVNGSITISSSTTWTVAQGWRNYTNVIVNSGKTLTIASGLVVRCTGWLNVSGVISGNAKGGAGGNGVSSNDGGTGGGVLTIYAAKVSITGTVYSDGSAGGNAVSYLGPDIGAGVAGSSGSGGGTAGGGGQTYSSSYHGGAGGLTGGGGGSGGLWQSGAPDYLCGAGGGGGGGAGSISFYVYDYWSNSGYLHATGGVGGNAYASGTYAVGGYGGNGGLIYVYYSPVLGSITLGTVYLAGGSGGTSVGTSNGGDGSSGSSSSSQDSSLASISYTSGQTSTSFAHYYAENGLNTSWRYDFTYPFPAADDHQLNCTFPKGMAVINLTETGGNTVVSASLYSVVSHNTTHNKVVIPEATLTSKGYSYKLFVSSIGYVYSITPSLVDLPTSSTLSFTCRLRDQSGNNLAQAVWVSIWDASVEKSHVSGTSNAQGWYNSTITAPSTAGTYYLRANTTGGVKQTTITVFTGSGLTSEYGNGFIQFVQYKYDTPAGYALQIYYDTGDDTAQDLFGAAWVAQTFTTSGSFTITQVSIYAARVGALPYTFYVNITAVDANHKPTGSKLCSGSVDPSGWSTSVAWHNITLGSGSLLSASTEYAIEGVLSGGGASNKISWQLDSSTGYSGGGMVISANSGGSWTYFTQYDCMFRTYSTSTTTTSGSQAASDSKFWASTSANTTWRETFSYSFPASTNRQLNCTFPLGRSIINLTETTGNTLLNGGHYSVVQHNSTHMKIIIPEATIADHGNAYKLFTSSVSSVNSILKDYVYNSPSRSLSFNCLLEKPDGNVYASLDLWVSIWNSTNEISHTAGTTGAGGWWNSTIALPATVHSYNLRANCTGGVAYVTVYVTKITVTLSISDARIDIATPASMPGTAVYSVDSSWVPSGTITVNGNSSTITSGAYTYAPQYNTVGQRTITVTAATDAGGCNSLTAQQSQNVVWDRIRITGSGVVNGRISVAETGKFWATAELEHDSHALGSGDSIIVSGISMTWNATSSRFEGTDVQSSVTTITYDTFTSGSEADYGITAGFMNGFSESISWDKARVYYQVLNDSTVTVGQAIEYRVKIILLLDGHALGSGDTVTANAGAMIWDAVNGWFEVTKVLNTAGNYTFSISSLLEDTYGIDAFEANVSDPMGTWEGWIVVTLSVPDDRIDVSTNATILVAAEYGWNGTACSLSSITLNDTTTKASPGTYGYNVSAAVESYYGITNVTCNSVSVGFDRLVEFDKGNNITATVHPGEWVRAWFKVRSELDSAFVQAGSVSINGSAATWDAVNSRWYLDVPVTWWNIHKVYVVTAVSWTTYGITALNSGVATNSTGFTPTGWIIVTISFSRPRIDLGTNAIIFLTVGKVYGWNSAPCSLTVYALNDTTTKGAVGKFGFKIASLTETAYSITNFTTNDISMIWERVEGLLSLSGAVLHRVDAGINATILFPQLWYASDHSSFSGTLTLNDTTTKATPNRYGYEIASITDSLYLLTGFTTNATYVIFDAMNVTGVTWGGMDSFGRIKLTPVVKSAYDGSAFTGYVDINGTRAQIGVLITVPFTQSGQLIIRGWNETTYGLTRALVNKTWLVYLSEYRLTSEYNKTLSVIWYPVSKMLQVATASDVIQVICPAPHAVTFNGFPKAPGDGWNYSSGVLTVVVPSSLSIGVWFVPPSSSGPPSSDSDSSGGSTSATRVYLSAVMVSNHPQFSSDRLIEIRQYRIDNVALTEIDKAYIIIGLPLDAVMSLNVSRGEAELEEYNSTACMFLASDVRPTDDRSIVVIMAAQLPGDAGKVINIGGFRMTYVQWIFFGSGIAIWVVLILLAKGRGFFIGFVVWLLVYFLGSAFSHVNPLMIDYSMTLPAISGLDAAMASLDEFASSHLAEIGVFFIVAIVVLFLLRKVFGRKY